MARPSPPMPLLAAALLVAGAIPLGFIWILTSAKFEIGGASPGESTVGKVENIDQRAMEQFCTGVRATPAGTWLVGRREAYRDEQALPEGVIDLDLVAASPSPGKRVRPPPLQLPQRHAAIRRRSGNHLCLAPGRGRRVPRSGAARRDRLPGSHAGRFQRLPAHRPAAPGQGQRSARADGGAAQRRPGQELAAARGRLHGRGESTGLGSRTALPRQG